MPNLDSDANINAAIALSQPPKGPVEGGMVAPAPVPLHTCQEPSAVASLGACAVPAGVFPLNSQAAQVAASAPSSMDGLSGLICTDSQVTESTGGTMLAHTVANPSARVLGARGGGAAVFIAGPLGPPTLLSTDNGREPGCCGPQTQAMAAVCSDRMPQDTLAALPAFVLWLTECAAAASDARRAADASAVTLTTLHRSKGREWDHVFLVDVAEGQLPLQPPPSRGRGRSGGDPHHPPPTCRVGVSPEGGGGLEAHMHDADVSADEAGEGEAAEEVDVAEERRLLYVGMTRAKRTLCVSWAAEDARGRACAPSPFLADLPEACCRRGAVDDVVVEQAREGTGCGGGALWGDGVRVTRASFSAVLEVAREAEGQVQDLIPCCASIRSPYLIIHLQHLDHDADAQSTSVVRVQHTGEFQKPL